MVPIPSKTLRDGFSLPVIGLGTWPMGGYRTQKPDNDDERDIAAIRFALDQGITHLDTAEIYAAGYAGQLLGRAIVGYDRSKLQIASKASRNSLTSKDALKAACKASLTRAGIEYFDLYYIHWRHPEAPLKPQIEAMEELCEEGLIRNIGVSNFKTSSFVEAQDMCKYKIVANQVHYNLIFRGPERDGLLEYCQKNDVLMVAYRPVELGKLANTGNPVMLDIADANPGWTHAQIAISWVISQPNVVALFGGSSTAFIAEDIKAVQLRLSGADIEHGRTNYGGQIEVSDSVPLA